MRIRLCLFVPAALLAVASLNAQSGPAGGPEKVRTFNNAALFDAIDAYRSAGIDSAATLVQLRAVAAERQQRLQDLMISDPAAALRATVPDNLRDTYPPDVQDLIERQVALHGQMEVAIEEGRGYSQIHYTLVAGAKQVALHFADRPPGDLQTGTDVHVDGVQSGEHVALTSGGMTLSSSASILPGTFGAQKTLVMLVNFQDNTTQPWTPQTVQSMVFTTASNFWLENSYQQTWLTGEVAGWYTLPISSSTCNYSSIATYAQQAAQANGFVLTNYTRYLYMFPQLSTCGWEGYSTIGGNPSSSWDNGSISQLVIAHELGHALGLNHAHSLSCGSVVYATSGCTQYEYGDYYDSMGNSSVNGYSFDYNAFQKERLGWLNYSTQPSITTVTSGGSYPLAPLETQDSNPKALKILQSSSTGLYYYVEVRRAIGFDNLFSYSVPGYSGVLNGVVVHMASVSNANSSNLLNMNPSASLGTAMALDVGQNYTDSTAGITIATTAVSSTGATVQVTLAAGTCAPGNPSVNISPSSQSAAAGAVVSYTVTVTDHDSSACSNSTFNLTATVPSGWSSALGNSLLTLAPGASVSTTLQVTAPAGTANGSYGLGMSAANAMTTTYTASAIATFVVSTPVAPSITESTNQSTYSSGQNVSVTVNVHAGSSPTAGAAVTVNITKSNGSVTSMSGTTGSNGVAVLAYRLKKTDPTGTYQSKASTMVNGTQATTSTTFMVQ